MVARSPAAPLSSPPPPKGKISILIIEARYYEDVADELLMGAIREIEEHGATYDRVVVPGALEIPSALAQAAAAEVVPKGAACWRWCGTVALGCVIRGETAHFDVVCQQTNYWLMETALRHKIPVGNGVLTVDTKEQARARARGPGNGKGGEAVRACLKILELWRIFQDKTP